MHFSFGFEFENKREEWNQEQQWVPQSIDVPSNEKKDFETVESPSQYSLAISLPNSFFNENMLIPLFYNNWICK